MSQEITSRRRGFPGKAATRHRFAISVWCLLTLVAWLLYEQRQLGTAVSGQQVVVAALLAGFAGMLSYFAWLLYVPTRRGTDSPVRQCLAGLATLIPPCVIGLAILPEGSSLNPWFVGFLFVAGCFALLTPAQEHLFACEPPVRRTPRIDVDPLPEPDAVEDENPGILAMTSAVASPPRAQPRRRTPGPQPPAADPAITAAELLRPGRADTERVGAGASEHDTRLTTELHRTQDETGADCLQGTVVAHFALGQKRTSVHIPFQPPFAHKPEITCDLAEVSGVRLKTPIPFTYGVRLELSRRDSGTEESFAIPVFAR